jgi:glycosyltransferase involved in cell wall biosynthesis
VVVPAHNEAGRIRLAAYRSFIASTLDVDLLFVDDGSTDETLALLQGFAAEQPQRCRVMALPRNAGKGEAVRQGMCRALEATPTPAVVGYLDADLAAPIEAVTDIGAAFARDGEVWAVFGSRVQLLGRHVQRSALRHYLGRVFATAASLTLALPVYDTQCGCKLFRNIPPVREAFAAPFISRWIFDVELLARLRDAPGPPPERRFREVPLERWVETGRSSVRLGDFLRAPLELWAIRRRHPPARPR